MTSAAVSTPETVPPTCGQGGGTGGPGGAGLLVQRKTITPPLIAGLPRWMCAKSTLVGRPSYVKTYSREPPSLLILTSRLPKAGLESVGFSPKPLRSAWPLRGPSAHAVTVLTRPAATTIEIALDSLLALSMASPHSCSRPCAPCIRLASRSARKKRGLTTLRYALRKPRTQSESARRTLARILGQGIFRLPRSELLMLRWQPSGGCPVDLDV